MLSRTLLLLSLFFFTAPPSLIQTQTPDITVEIDVRDNIDMDSGGEVLSAHFDGKSLPLSPALPTGDRGLFYFRIQPGDYVINWKVNDNEYVYPRSHSYRHVLRVDNSDNWIHILIVGSDLTES